MSEKIEVYVTDLNRYVEVPGGTTLLELYTGLRGELSVEAVCARVNNKTEALNYALYAPKTVQFLPVTSPSGQRTYVRSLCMMLYHAVATEVPGTPRLVIEHSVSRGYYCRVEGGEGFAPDDTWAARLRDAMHRLVAADMPFERFERRTEDVVELFRTQGLHDKVKLLGTLHEPYTVYYRLGHLCDSFYGALAPSTGILRTFDLLPYHDGFLLLGPSDTNPEVPATPLVQEKMFGAFTDHIAFNSIVGIDFVGELNERVQQGDTPMLINVSEALHGNRIAAIADDITRRFRAGGARVVMIAGPSSSGKTTFTKRLAIQLMTNLLETRMVSLDDYFVDRHHTPLDADGEYDYESLYALDLDKFNTDLNRMIAGEEVELPYYNFERGQREYRGDKVKLGPNTVLLIEGIHGLNPELTAQVADEMKYRVYVSALTTISIDDHNWIPTTDNRLLRRIIRDARYRGVKPADTIKRWPSVRRGEERWIFPYQENADAMFNSSLLYELGVMKERAERLLRSVPHDLEQYAEAARLLTFLGYFEPLSEQYVPSTSLIREFLGGSSFHY